MSSMSDEQLQQLSQRMGRTISREMLRQGQQQLSNLQPEQVERLIKMQEGEQSGCIELRKVSEKVSEKPAQLESSSATLPCLD